MRLMASKEDGILKMGTKTFPGIVIDVQVDGELVVDSKRRPNRSGTSKQPKGYNDMEVKIRITLPRFDTGNDPHQDAKTIINVFFGLDKKRRPAIHRIHNKACRAVGIRRVIFADFSLRDAMGRSDSLQLTLTPTQYRPIPKLRKRKPLPKVEVVNRISEDGLINMGELFALAAAGFGDQEITQLAKLPPSISGPAPFPGLLTAPPPSVIKQAEDAAKVAPKKVPLAPASIYEDPFVVLD